MSPEQLMEKKAKRLSIYIGESDQWRGKALYLALVEMLRAKGMAGATVSRGLAGFGAHSVVHTASILRLSLDLPLIINVIDSPEKINNILKVIAPMVGEGLMILEDVEVVKYTHRYLNPLPADKLVSEVMTRKVITLKDTMPVAEAWEIMLKHLLKALPVLNAGGDVVGVLTDEDLVERAGIQQRLSVAERLDEQMLQSELDSLRASLLKVADVMTSPATTILSNESLGVAAARMAEHRIKRLPVLDESGKLIGVLSRVDVLKQVISEEARKRNAKAPSGAVHILSDIMLSEIPTIHEDAQLADVIARFLEAGTRRLIVTDGAGRPLGLISDADAVTRVQPAAQRGVMQALRGKRNIQDEKTTAVQLMSGGVLSAPPDTSLTEAAHMMLSQKRKWMVVVDEKGRAIGLVDRQVLLKALSCY
jgi:CBS domain-containing protein/PII-like signaling protein